MRKIFFLIKVFVFYFLLQANGIAKEPNYLNKGIKLFKNKEFEKSKIQFEKDIVFNPKNERC